MKRKLLKPLQMKNSVNQENSVLGKKLFTNNFSMKTFFVLLIANLFSFAVSAQNASSEKTTPDPDAITGVALYLQNTQLSIFADQKYLLMTKVEGENKDLANAILLHKYAQKLYDSNNQKDALICSSKARQLGVALLASFRGADYASNYNNFEREEAQIAQLKNDTSSIDKWIALAKQ